jgi:hypothetical protein
MCLYTNLSKKAMWERLTKMSLQAHRTVFYDGIVNEVEAQHGGYYYGEKDTTGNTERRTIQTL